MSNKSIVSSGVVGVAGGYQAGCQGRCFFWGCEGYFQCAQKKSGHGAGPDFSVDTVKEYLFIQVWGDALRSTQDFIDDQIVLARAENAPERAVYRDANGRWVTVDDCVPRTRSTMERRVAAKSMRHRKRRERIMLMDCGW